MFELASLNSPRSTPILKFEDMFNIASSPGPLSISQLLILHAKSGSPFACNIKSWEIERGLGDEAMFNR